MDMPTFANGLLGSCAAAQSGHLPHSPYLAAKPRPYPRAVLETSLLRLQRVRQEAELITGPLAAMEREFKAVDPLVSRAVERLDEAEEALKNLLAEYEPAATCPEAAE